MPNLNIDTERCIGCAECVAICPVRCLEMDGDVPVFAENKESQCMECQQCLALCPTAALSIMGVDPDECTELKGNLPTAQQVETLLAGRRSTRFYKDENVDEQTMQRLLDHLAYAPTGKNNRELGFTIIDDRDVMNAVRRETLQGIEKRVESDTLPPGMEFFEVAHGAWQKGVDLVFRGAPHMLVVTTPENGPSPEADPIIALSYFELHAASLGLGTVWCGFAKWAMFTVAPEVGAKLGIPEGHKVGYAMMFGWPDATYRRTVKRELKGLNRVRWDA